MVVFEVAVNGERRFIGEDVTAITLVSEFLARRKADRVSMHIGTGQGEHEVHHLDASLVVGDEVTIRLLEDDELDELGDETLAAPSECSFCGADSHGVASLVAANSVAICSTCLTQFSNVVRLGGPLPMGSVVWERPGEFRCGFCDKGPPAVSGLLVRNNAGICAECLRSCVELHEGVGE